MSTEKRITMPFGKFRNLDVEYLCETEPKYMAAIYRNYHKILNRPNMAEYVDGSKPVPYIPGDHSILNDVKNARNLKPIVEAIAKTELAMKQANTNNHD